MTKSLILKELEESIWAFYAALFMLLGFGSLAMFASGGQWGTEVNVALLMIFGVPVAILLGVGSACRDLREPVLTFWRSRPILTGQFIAVKFLTGLVAVMLVALISMVPAIAFFVIIPTASEVPSTLACYGVAMGLVYAASFLIGSLVRDAAQAAILSLAAAMVILFAPLILPPLEPVSVFNLIQEEAVRVGERGDGWHALNLPWTAGDLSVTSDYLRFLFLSVIGIGLAGYLAFEAVRSDWRLKMDQKLICWTLGGLGLLMFGSAAYQVGSNVEPTGFVKLPEGARTVRQFVVKGGRGVVLADDDPVNPTYSVMSLDLTGENPVVGNPIRIHYPVTQSPRWTGAQVVWDPSTPEWAHVLVCQNRQVAGENEDSGLDLLKLVTVRLSGEGGIVHELDLMGHLPIRQGGRPNDPTYQSFPLLVGEEFLSRPEVLVKIEDDYILVSLGDPTKPEVTRTLRVLTDEWMEFHKGLGYPAIQALQVDENTAEFMFHERHEQDWKQLLAKKTYDRWHYRSHLLMAFDPDHEVVAAFHEEAINTYRLVDVSATEGSLEPDRYLRARFERVGSIKPSPLEKLAQGPYIWTRHFAYSDGRVFLQQPLAADSLAVYDVRDAENPRRVGHFTRPELRISALAATDDGRVLLGADGVYVFDP